MRASRETAIGHVLDHEGGYVNDPRDAGGCTNRGITLATWRAHGHPRASCAEVARITREQAAAIYAETYWVAVDGDALPAGLDLLALDHGVNAGTRRAIALLRTLVGVAPAGSLTAATLQALGGVARRDRPAAVRKYSDLRRAYYGGLRQFPVFGKGWLRRVDVAERLALALVAAAPRDLV